MVTCFVHTVLPIQPFGCRNPINDDDAYMHIINAVTYIIGKVLDSNSATSTTEDRADAVSSCDNEAAEAPAGECDSNNHPKRLHPLRRDRAAAASRNRSSAGGAGWEKMSREANDKHRNLSLSDARSRPDHSVWRNYKARGSSRAYRQCSHRGETLRTATSNRTPTVN